MGVLPEAALAAVLQAHNPWWRHGVLPRSAHPGASRPVDAEIGESEASVLVVGPRRAGKTSLLLRLADTRLRSGTRDVAYLPVDHPVLRMVDLGPLVDSATRWLASDNPLVLLDNVQALPQWPERLLELLKTRPRVRVIATASVAPGVQDPALDVHFLGPWSFREFCAERGLADLAPPLDLLAPQFPDEDGADDRLFQRVLDPLLADYLVRGGFPDAGRAPDPHQAHRRLREDIIAAALYRDLPSVVGVHKLADLERVLVGVLLLNGEPLMADSFSEALELGSNTLGKYLGHLERAFLLESLRNFAASTDRSRPRLYPTDPGLYNALFERGAADLADATRRRSVLVGSVVAHVARVARTRGFDVAYFRDGDLEAELMLVTPEGGVPIRVFDRDPAPEDLSRIERLLRRTGATSAFVLSRAGPRRSEPLSFFETVHHLPAAYFLYGLG